MTPKETPSATDRPGRSTWRVGGLIIVSAVAVYVSVVSTYQILHAGLFPELMPTQYSCSTGVAALYESIGGARERAARVNNAERAALAAFRTQLQPVWKHEPAIRELCAAHEDGQAMETLRAVLLLRYAEERAVRTDALDLAQWRKRAPKQVRTLSNTEEKN